ncbi:MAG: ZIP family metal transporter [Candidatus Paceibacterota bacterium]|jgi:ZIP family zinc transporter
MILIFSIIASIAAILGGMIALKMRDKLHLILGFSAGAVIGAALFDLIPESIELGQSFYHIEVLTSIVAGGFLFYLVLDRLFSFHEQHRLCDRKHDHEQQSLYDTSSSKPNTIRGSLGAASFCLHSLIDGIAIGLAFQASTSIGTIVAIAVIAHRFSDGINTVGVILKNRGEVKNAKSWLIAVGLAPVVGALLTFAFSVKDNVLAIILAIFAGFFLYIGASDLIPEGHHSHSKILTTVMTLIGAVFLYFIVLFAHGI